MLRKRIIFGLIYADGFFQQSRNFRLQKVGDINWLFNNFNFENVAEALDEIFIINASLDRRDKTNMEDFLSVLKIISSRISLPISSGGGIYSETEADNFFKFGADKIVVNSLFLKDLGGIKSLSEKYGRQSICLSLDYKRSENSICVDSSSGSLTFKIENLSELGGMICDSQCGEVLFTSIDNDGTGFGYDFESFRELCAVSSIPLILSGGAGNKSHFKEALLDPAIDAIATTNLFNFVGDSLIRARKFLIANDCNLRL